MMSVYNTVYTLNVYLTPKCLILHLKKDTCNWCYIEKDKGVK
jgi:hypothetical protein